MLPPGSGEGGSFGSRWLSRAVEAAVPLAAASFLRRATRIGVTGRQVAFSIRADLVAVEVHDEMRAVDVWLAAALQGVDVVPALRVERIGQHRRAEQVADLAAGHADGHLVDVLDLEQVALLDVRPVDAASRAQRGAQQQGQERGRRAAVAVMLGWLMLSGVTGPGR